MGSDDFFDAQDPRSIIKTAIIEKYFDPWAKIVQPHSRGVNNQIFYLDLFSGPGRYKDGTPSTPLLVLQKAIASPVLQQRLVTTFNDKEAKHAERLREEIKQLDGANTLRYEPEVGSDEVGDELVEQLKKTNLVPTLCFIDPWGYKGLTLDLIGQAIKSWGCDCIFFFNYNRI